jgi:hypothetical protein
VNYVLQIEPVLVKRPEGYMCLLCGEVGFESAPKHVLRRHRDVLDSYTNYVASRCLNKK